MTNRRRKEDEPFGDYREALKEEAKVERVRLKGKWVWRSAMPIQDEDEIKWVKTPPYRRDKHGKL